MQIWEFEAEKINTKLLSSQYPKKITMDYNVDEIVPNFYYCLLYI